MKSLFLSVALFTGILFTGQVEANSTPRAATLSVGGYYVCPVGFDLVYHPGGVYQWTEYQLQWVWTGWQWIQQYVPVWRSSFIQGGYYCVPAYRPFYGASAGVEFEE